MIQEQYPQLHAHIEQARQHGAEAARRLEQIEALLSFEVVNGSELLATSGQADVAASRLLQVLRELHRELLSTFGGKGPHF